MAASGQSFLGWGRVAIAHVEMMRWAVFGTISSSSYPVVRTRWRAWIRGPSRVATVTPSRLSSTAVASTGEGYAVFQVADIRAAHAPDFEQYKSHIADDFRDQQLPQLLASKTNALAAAAKKDGNLAAAAKSVGATVKSQDFVGRDGHVPDLGQLGQMAPQIFNLGDGQISTVKSFGML